MSVNILITPGNEQSPEHLEQRIGQLIGHYLATRSPAIAGSVVRHIDALCSHPAFEGDSGARCSYLRLKAHWRWLANGRDGALTA